MSTPVTTSLNPGRRVSLTERVTVRARGRVCAHEGCDTILSIYNPTRYCSAHVQEAAGRRRTSSQTPRRVACEHCGEEFETMNTHRRYCSDRCRMAAFARRKRAAERALRLLDQRAAAPAGSQAAQCAEDAA
jgi:hypothetical protein